MLVNTMPDPPLLEAADKGELKDPEVIAKHARRLLETPRGRETLRDFLDQWMITEEYPSKLVKDAKTYPTVTPELAGALGDETARFFEEITFEQGKGLRSLLTAPFAYANKVTAPIYGAQKKDGSKFGDKLERVELDPAQRPGFLTQVAFLATRAYSFRSDPIHRGVFVQRRVLCTNVPSPTVTVGQLPPPSAGKTTREIVDEHTSGETCRGCHAIINPVGFGFENYGGIGEWRTMDNGKPVDPSGALPGTEKASTFKTPAEMMSALADSPEARACWARQWFQYAYGREAGPGDECALEVIATKLGDDGYDTRELLVDLALTRAFVSRTPN
jgi:hypothetical protein